MKIGLDQTKKKKKKHQMPCNLYIMWNKEDRQIYICIYIHNHTYIQFYNYIIYAIYIVYIHKRILYIYNFIIEVYTNEGALNKGTLNEN